MKIEDRIRHFLRLAEDPGASASERELAAARAEQRIAEMFPEVRVSRSRVQLDRDEVSQGEGDGYRSGVGTPSWQGVDGGRVAIGR